MSDKRVLFIQHGDADKPGLLAEAFEDLGIALSIIRSDLGDDVPTTLEAYSGLVLGGGRQGAYEQEKFPYLARECALVRQALAEERPVLGICLGAQLMAAALGAGVRPSQPEVGFFEVMLDPISQYDPVWRGLPPRLVVPHWHGDAFDIPPGGMRLASSDRTPNQLFRYGHALYGIQFHLEMTEPLFEEMVLRSGHRLGHQGVDAERMRREACDHLSSLRDTAATVFGRWADMLC